MSKTETHRTQASAATVKPLAGLLVVALEQAVGADLKAGRNLCHRVTPFNELADRFDLEFFWKSFLIHGASY